ncbi:CHAD domain-containing protein [Candidatus Sumerlaeota bacterium]|nr:CHAD domain-containing protein [Candidatus Sumerlaeota bacterium]
MRLGPSKKTLPTNRKERRGAKAAAPSPAVPRSSALARRSSSPVRTRRSRPKTKPVKPSVDFSWTRNAAVILQERRGDLVEQIRLVRRGMTAERIHDLRVASRRFRAVLSTFRPLVDGPGFRKTRRLARSITRKPGALRNRDVGREILGAVLAKRLGPEIARAATLYRRELDSDRQDRRAEIGEFVRGVNLGAFEKRFLKIAGRLESGRDLPLTREAILSPILERLDGVFECLEPALDPDRAVAQHRLRIAFKRLRYTFEIFAFAFDAGRNAILRRMKGFQDVLGELHDMDVLLEGLASRLSRESDPARKSDFQRLVEHLKRERLRLFRRFRRRAASLAREGFEKAIRESLRVDGVARPGSVAR